MLVCYSSCSLVLRHTLVHIKTRLRSIKLWRLLDNTSNWFWTRRNWHRQVHKTGAVFVAHTKIGSATFELIQSTLLSPANEWHSSSWRDQRRPWQWPHHLIPAGGLTLFFHCSSRSTPNMVPKCQRHGLTWQHVLKQDWTIDARFDVWRSASSLCNLTPQRNVCTQYCIQV